MTNKIKHCFTMINEGDDKFRVVKIIYKQSGYYALGKINPDDPTELDKFVGDFTYVENICENWNKRLGISAEEEMEIVASSMGGQ